MATRVLLWCGILTLTVAVYPRLSRALPLNDFLEYWSAARLFVNGGNPYSPVEMLDLQRGLGWKGPGALMMFNPPWVLPLIAPLAALPFGIAQISWFVVSAVLLFGSADFLWRHYGGRPDRRIIAWVCAVLFLPNLIALRMGQFAPFILFALTGFLTCLRRQRPWLAGTFLLGLGIKPHLCIPVAIVVAIWTIRDARWRVAGGTLLATVTSLVIAWIINPGVLIEYIGLWRSNPPMEFVSGFGGVLRLMFGFDRTWLQLVPAFFGIAWVLSRWHRYRMRWDWDEQTPVLILASYISAPYSWTFDQSVLMIPLVRSAAWMVKGIRPFVVGVFVAVNVVMMAMLYLSLSDTWLLWSAPLWALLCATVEDPKYREKRERQA